MSKFKKFPNGKSYIIRFSDPACIPSCLILFMNGIQYHVFFKTTTQFGKADNAVGGGEAHMGTEAMYGRDCANCPDTAIAYYDLRWLKQKSTGALVWKSWNQLLPFQVDPPYYNTFYYDPNNVRYTDRTIASNESDRALKDQNEPQRRKDHKGEEK